MLQTKHDRFHRHAPLEEPAGGVEQPQTSPQPQHQMPIVGSLLMNLARLRRPQMLQRAEGVFNPTAPFPGPDQTGSCTGCHLTEQVGACLAWFLDDDHGNRPVRGAGGCEPCILHPRQLEAVAPGPVPPGDQVLTRHPAPVGQLEDIGTLALYDHGPMLVVRQVRQPLRVAKPAIGDDQGGWPHEPQPRQGGPGPIQHDLHPGQLVAAGPARPHRVRTTDGEVHRNDQRPLPDHDDQPQPIDAEPDAMFLAAIPEANQPQLLARFLEDAVIAHPRPWPATAGGQASALDLVPQGHQEIVPAVRQLPPPLLLGQGTQALGGQVLIPPSHSSQFVVGAAAKQGGEHQPKYLPHQFPYRFQSPLDLRRQRLWQTQVDQRLFQGVQRALCASLLALELLAVLLKAAVLRVELSSLGTCHGGHGLLRWFMVACMDETMARSSRHFKSFHVAPSRFALWTRPRGQTGIVRNTVCPIK
jgi:hypothetical protein